MKAIYLTGTDGSGKTTYLKEIERFLNAQGKKTNHIWIRSPKIFSKPLMAYCRLVGLTKYKTINGTRYGGHEFYRSAFVSWLFPILQLLDIRIKWFFIKRNLDKDSLIIFDRFSIDTLADLMVDTHRFDLHKTKIGRGFLNMIPKDTKIVVLEVDEQEIRKRKKDTMFDPHLDIKVKVYKILAKDLNLLIIDNNQPQKTVREKIFITLGLNERV